MADCEDQSIMDTLGLFAPSGKVDLKRVLVMRTASDYTREGDGQDPVLQEYTPGGIIAAYEAAFRTVAPVTAAIVKGWAEYKDSPPRPTN